MSESKQTHERSGLISHALSEHSGMLRAFVRARAPLSQTEDILQSAALRAIERADSLKDPSKVLPWLYQIHRNVIVDQFRAQASRERMLARAQALEPTSSATTSPRGEEPETCACSTHLARKLPENYASILKLVDLGDSSISEAASRLGITSNNAMVRLHRARQALKKTLLEHCGVSHASECFDCRCVHEGCCPT